MFFSPRPEPRRGGRTPPGDVLPGDSVRRPSCEGLNDGEASGVRGVVPRPGKQQTSRIVVRYLECSHRD